jgi:aspartyl-tRNA(Asn)/glutamyl-tRNA(Gln) amidotransferase subunit A
MDAVALTALIKSRKLSPVEVVEAALARIDQLDTQLHAFCTLTPDIAHVEARRAEADLIAGRNPGLLAGVPVGQQGSVDDQGRAQHLRLASLQGFRP